MPREKDPLWEYGTEDEGKIKCSFCEKGVSGGITRFKYHLAQVAQNNVEVCARASPDARDAALAAIADLQSRPRKPRKKKNRSLALLRPQSGVSGCGSSATCTENPLAVVATAATPSPTVQTRKPKGKDKERIDLLLVKFVVVNNLPFHALRSPDFQEAIMAIANYGPGYVPPTYDMFRTKLLEDLKGQAAEYVEEVRRTWSTTGCTLMASLWKDNRGRAHLNLLASSPKGTVFLKSQCFSLAFADENPSFLVDFICNSIDEIGPENVIQIVTVKDPEFVAAGRVIEEKYPNIFKTSCAAHLLDLMLEEVGKLPRFQETTHHVRKIINFITKNEDAFELMKTHTKGKELQKPLGPRFLKQLCCLHSIIAMEESLRKMVASAEWQSSPNCTSEEGRAIIELLQGEEFWKLGKENVGSIEPLVKVLRMVDGDGSTMGYLYEALHRSKESIKSFLESNVEKYMPLWQIIDSCWHNELQNPLCTLAAYLNPHLFYDKMVTMAAEVRAGLEKVIQKMAPGSNSAQVAQELTRYHARDRKIFSGIGVDLLRTAHPRIWWEMCGSEIPILQTLAIKILSQPCSASACERNKSALKASHVKKKNNLGPKALSNLVHMRMNLQLKKASVEKRKKDIAPLFLENMEAFRDGDSMVGSKRGGNPLFQDVGDDSSDSEGDDGDHSGHAENQGTVGNEFLMS